MCSNVYGHVPHCGCFVVLFINPALDDESKLLGFEAISGTHQEEISRLKAEAEENIKLIFVTLLVSQFPIGWLKAEAQ